MFPIRDARGRMQGFGARALRPDQKPKYVNSPESELFRKSRMLYGIDLARPAIAKAGRAVVVEGYTDVIAAPPGGDRRGGRGHGHGDHAGAGEAARPHYRGGGAGARRRQRRPRGDAARAAGGGASGCGCGWPRWSRAPTLPTCWPGRRGRREALRRAARHGGRSAGLPRSHAARRRRPALAVRARPGARRGGCRDRRDARLDHPRGADARGRRPPRRRCSAAHRPGEQSERQGGRTGRRARARPRSRVGGDRHRRRSIELDGRPGQSWVLLDRRPCCR